VQVATHAGLYMKMIDALAADDVRA